MTAENSNTDGRKAETVAALMARDEVPLPVRFWLGRYVEEGDDALDGWEGNTEESSLDLARLIYSALNAPHLDVRDHDREDAQAAVNFIEDFLWRGCEETHTHAYNVPDVAVAALPYILDGSKASMDCDVTVNALETAIKRLTTNRTRRHFFPTLADEDERPEAEAKEDRDYFAARKLARLMADPRTPKKVAQRLGLTFCELTVETRLSLDHSALVEQAAVLAFEMVAEDADRRDPAAKLYRRLLTQLDKLPEAPEGKGGVK
jgi:hypothetical protein